MVVEPSSISNNGQTATLNSQPLASETSNTAVSSMTAESDSDDSDKTAVAVFAGGGIVAVIVTILILLL